MKQYIKSLELKLLLEPLMKKVGLLLLITFIFSNLLLAQSKVGTVAAPFLGISIGPKALGMGSAFVASANDASALYWNPSGISRVMKSQFIASHTTWLVGTNLNWAGLSINLDNTNSIGVSFTQLDYGEDIVTTVLNPEGTGERWNAQDIAIGLTYARNLTDRFSIGGTVKYIGQQIYNESASAFAVDIGLLYITEFNDLKIGMSISNFGTDMKMDGRDLVRKIDLDPGSTGNNPNIPSVLKTDAWALPLFFRVGVAMDVVKTNDIVVTLAADAFRPSDNNSSVNVGMEFSWNDLIFIRGGYKNLFLTDTEEGLNIGGGLKYNFVEMNYIHFDYAFTSFGKFDNLHTFSLGILF
jgi:opacity protein-like surface antigen